MRLHGSRDDYLLYIELLGVFRGPGTTYPLLPWPHDTLGVQDGMAKVAIRAYSSGRLWESSAGSVSIDSDGLNQGSVFAGLGGGPSAPYVVTLTIAGPWRCLG